MIGDLRRLGLIAALLLVGALSVPPAGGAQSAEDLCAETPPNVNCGPGNGRQTAGGGDTKQRDYLSGGSGNDWIYPSHGRTRVLGGPGQDYIYAFYGKGTIDCGPGRDVARIRTNGAFRTRNCETIKHFCAFGSDAKGNCLSPTGKPVTTSRRVG